ncbi:hypothetical protein CFC21_057112 [Triticum aestivum]|uniref:Uncharacterized protein n=2 Tax=Triticum aestivum TaxID=4565 RepID=A0A9R1KBX5_WHEAT|nr:hypothetical protein CFC21_057111 [Triticum aestivum]KAF7048327.1 hypothetical protein CFC21_057112 [Triticum aestivum]
MGVPSFYRWLVEKYPNIVAPAVEEEDCPAGGGAAVYFDNLYLDMNGIIHPCFHPEDQTACPPPATFDEVFQSMFDYMDLLLRIVRPRRLLYLAVDGVAPRAKMNQQRARRFKSAKAAKEELEENLMRERFRAQGKEVLPRDDTPREVSDPNIITPGTEFMEKLSAALEYYVRARLSSDPRWKDVKVILSDANVPGEGEHKIMSFIRGQRSMENYDPNTRHCLYGLDADLIMLALASHEVHFSILREDVLRQNHQPDICVPVTGRSFTAQELPKVKCRGWFPRITEARSKGKLPKKPYQFLNIWVLREYVELEMTIPGCKQDIDRLIDDFIFICFLTGNDFIPHIPSLEIHEYAVDLLIDVYKTTYNKMGGYIVDTDKIKDKHAAYVKISRLEKFLHELSLHEEKIFLKRFELREKLLCKIQCQAAEDEWNERNYGIVEESADGLERESISACNDDKPDVTENTSELKRNLKDKLRSKQDLFKNGSFKHDRIRLGLPGWKSRFYKEKFGAETSNEIGRLQTEMVQKYSEGLCWVLRYYFSDVPSWSWYYPFYYAPFASDLKRLSQFKISFTVDKPLRPFDQLMAVLPPESSCALPKCYSKLMGCEESAIQMFYPSDLAIDTHGKRFLWQGVAKLPFIDVKLLLSATKTVEKDLALHEMRRNTIRQEKILLRNPNSLANNAVFAPISEKKILISTSEITGWLSQDEDGPSNGLFRSPIRDLPDITHDQTISAVFFNPEAVKPISRLLDNVIVPDKTVAESDIRMRPMWHTYPGPRPPTVTCRPDTLWKGSSPAMQPREEVKNAGTGWMGRGRGGVGAAPTEAHQIGRSSFGLVRGDAAGGAEALKRTSGSYGRGFQGGRFDGVGDGGAYSFRPGGGWAGRGSAAQKQQQTAWRPVGTWARGGGRGGSGQPRAW